MYTKHIEGVEGLVPYKGPVEEVVVRTLAGIRSGFSYCGSHNLEELWKNAEFVQITNEGITEGKSHSITELRNYKIESTSSSPSSTLISL